MNSSPPEPDDTPAFDRDSPANRGAPGDNLPERGEESWLEEIVVQLEKNPQECWQAMEGLARVEPQVRLTIIDRLSALGPRPGTARLLALLSSANDPATRSAAQLALNALARSWEGEPLGDPRRNPARTEPRPSGNTQSRLERIDQPFTSLAVCNGSGPRLASCVVTPVDGRGRATIVVSVNKLQDRATAAFLCDVVRGIRDVVGEVEPESDRAGGLIDVFDSQPGGDCVRDVPELALPLLAGSLMLNDVNATHLVHDWLVSTVGPEFRPAELPALIPDSTAAAVDHAEMPERAVYILEACPSWLDDSTLTSELALEIWLREGRESADPARDAGAYRYLFEHRLIRRLELYGRMLLWMAWLWRFSGLVELSRSAAILASQLSDEQYAVPSHPFTVALTTRSLLAAQATLREADDPRSRIRG